MDVAGLDGDETPEIIIGTEKGFIRIFKYNGETWDHPDTASLGPDPYSDHTRIREVKAVDLDGDYPLEILCSTDDYGDPEVYDDAYSPHLHFGRVMDLVIMFTLAIKPFKGLTKIHGYLSMPLI